MIVRGGASGPANTFWTLSEIARQSCELGSDPVAELASGAYRAPRLTVDEGGIKENIAVLGEQALVGGFVGCLNDHL
jgi:hypothetical protein